jgi:alpha-amylase/alpha-mannosidase (GH57 family)
MNAWDHLPNATHIDWVIESARQHQSQWTLGRTPHDWYRDYAAAEYRLRGSYRHSILLKTLTVARDELQSVIHPTVNKAVNAAASAAILALVVYDDCAHLLDMSGEQLRTWATLSEQPAAALLLPAVIARERIAQLESV